MSEEELPIGAGGETLERHPSLDDRFDPAIRIVDYDPAWPVLAAEELRRLEEALDEVAERLEHIGSTAVPGLAAKPILDLRLSVAAVEPRQRYVESLERLGYLFAPAPPSRLTTTFSPSRRGGRGPTICTWAKSAAGMSSAISPSGTSRAPMRTRRRATRR